MQIEEVREEELDQLSQLYQQLLPNEVCLEKMREVLVRNRANPHHLILAAKLEGRVVGSLLAVCCDMLFGQCRPFMVIEDVVVDAEHRRRGIGRALMNCAHNHAQRLDCAYIMLVTDRRSPEPQEFYTALGYNTEGYCAFKLHLAGAATQ